MNILKVLSCCVVLLVACSLPIAIKATPLDREKKVLRSSLDEIIDIKVTEHLVKFEEKLDELLTLSKTNSQCPIEEPSTTTPAIDVPADETVDDRVESIKVKKFEEPLLPPTSCAEALQFETSPKNGIHHLYLPNSGLKQFPVYCMVDPENGTAWTVIQRRVSSKTDFFLDWQEYKNGFGDLHANFFIGLEKLYALTTQGAPQELWVQLMDASHVNASARYNAFAIDDENTRYRLNVLGDYHGDAGDSLRYSVGFKFATKDADTSNKCAKERRSGWWFDFCSESNLNGEYDSQVHKAGLTWFGVNDNFNSKKYVHMAIRPRK